MMLPFLRRKTRDLPVSMNRTNVLVEVISAQDLAHVLWRELRSNKIPRSGRDLIADLLANTGYAPSSIAVGTDPSENTDDMVALGSPVWRNHFNRRSRTASCVTYQVFLGASEANGYTLAEAAIFAGDLYQGTAPLPAGGVLFARVVHTPIVKTSAVCVTYTWEVPISSG